MLFAIGIVSTTLIAVLSDSLYSTSSSVILYSEVKSLALQGKGMFKYILLTLFSIKETSVLLYVFSSSLISLSSPPDFSPTSLSKK